MDSLLNLNKEKTRRFEALIFIVSIYTAINSAFEDPTFIIGGIMALLTVIVALAYSVYYKEKLAESAFLFAGIFLLSVVFQFGFSGSLIKIQAANAIYFSVFGFLLKSPVMLVVAAFSLLGHRIEQGVLTVLLDIAPVLMAYLLLKTAYGLHKSNKVVDA
jgi:uncharacterized membrane protein